LESKSTKSSWIGLLASCAALATLIWFAIHGHPALGFGGLVEEQTRSDPRSQLASAEQNAETAVIATNAEKEAALNTARAEAETAQAEAQAQAAKNTAQAQTQATQDTAQAESQAATAQTGVVATQDDSDAVQSQAVNTELARVDSAEQAEVQVAQAQDIQESINQRKTAESNALSAAGDVARRMAEDLRAASELEADQAYAAQLQAQRNNQNTNLLDAGDEARELAGELAESRAKLAGQKAARQSSETNALLAAGDRARQLAAQEAKSQSDAADQLKIQKQRENEIMVTAGDQARKLSRLRAEAEREEELAQQAVKNNHEAALLAAGAKARELSEQSTEEKLPSAAQKANEDATLPDSGDPVKELSSQASNAAASSAAAGAGGNVQTFESMRAEELSKLQEYAQEINFGTGEWILLDETRLALDSIFETLFLYSEVSVRLTVYSSDNNDSVVNKFVAQQRARTIKRYLLDRGLEAGQVSAVGAATKKDVKFTGVALAIREK